MEPRFSLKDQLFNEGKVRQLARELAHAHPTFDSESFVTRILQKLPTLELKERIVHITRMLYQHLPDDYSTATDIIKRALPPQLDPYRADDDFGDFIYAPYNAYIATYGCTKAYLPISFDMLHELTRRFSAEDAIRYFINAFPDETFAQIEQWSSDANYHVRRLCSEGTRHRLPWSQKLCTTYSRPISILDTLHTDPTRYVTRSVANHLNDISKVDPDLVIKTLKRWRRSPLQTPQELAYITRHALRTLIKKGHSRALKLVGADPSATVHLIHHTHTPTVHVGGVWEFVGEFVADRDATCVIDYRLTFPTKRAAAKSSKVFKLGQIKMKKGIPYRCTKRHMFRPMTTRTLTAGIHSFEIIVNGTTIQHGTFRLIFS